MLSNLEILKRFNKFVEVRDVFDILRQHYLYYGISVDEIGKDVGYDEWGRLIVEEMRTNVDSLQKYDTLLIDEAQDMKDWALEMVELLASPSAAICVAEGLGQELYGGSSRWLENFRKKARNKRLNRNFRDTIPVFQLAQCFYEARINISKIPETIQCFNGKTVKDNIQGVIFERTGGHPPLLVYIDDSELDYSDHLFIAETQFEVMTSEYERIINQQIDQMTEYERPIDLLVLVPNTDGLECKWAQAALSNIKKKRGIDFTDYTIEGNRRDIAVSTKIRLCTYHSSRGLEGMRVIVFGIEKIEDIARRTGVDCAKLGYIVLSRSIFENVIAIRNIRSNVVSFVEEAIKELRRGFTH